jgi:hypothetical protein
MNPPKTYLPTTLNKYSSNYVTCPPGIDKRVATLPAYERAIVEALVTALVDELHGVGRQTALEIVWAAGRWMRRGA